MVKLILNQKIKYKRKSHPVNRKGVTEPVPVEAKDVKYFEDAGMIVDAIDEKGKKLYLDKRDKAIEELEATVEKLQSQLAKKDEIITDLEVQIEDLKDNVVNDEPLEEKTVEELKTIATDLEIDGRSKLNKDELVEAIKVALAEKAGE